MLKIIKKTNLDFLAKRKIALTFSGLLILISLVSLILHSGPNLSIDFTGGLKIDIRISEPEGKPAISEELVRASLNQIGIENSEVKMSRSIEGENVIIQVKEEGRFIPPEALIRNSLESVADGEIWRMVLDEEIAPSNLPDLSGKSYVAVETDISQERLQNALDSALVENQELYRHSTIDGKTIWLLTGEGKDATSRIKRIIAQNFPDYTIDVRSIDRVGPRMGAELRIQAVLAILAALGLIVIYLWWRFELLFGIAAVVALFHDVLITLGLFSLLNLEISVTIIGAFLTVVGYSLNDTIVVFDRIRENLRRYKDSDYGKVVNRSINDNLSRTLITSLTTFVVVAVLFFNGGQVLHSFSIALMAGIIIGTYSSIFVASPILVEWAERTGKAAGRKTKKK